MSTTPASSRVEQALRSLALVVADDPEVAAACTTALLSNEAGVGSVRERIGADPQTHQVRVRARRRRPRGGGV